MKEGKLTIKLNIQLLAVDSAFAGALILRGVTSAGYNQVIPNHPIENQVLKRNKQSTETTCAALFPGPSGGGCSILYNPASTAIVAHCAAAVHNINGRRPALSIMVMATREVRK